MEKDKGETVAVVVRMNFVSLIHFFFVMGFLLASIIFMIPDIMESYSTYSRWIGIPLSIMFIIFLWGLGQQITTYITTYRNTRSVHGDIVVRMKDIHNQISTMRGTIEKVSE